MQKKHTLKTVLASILVTVALAAPITIVSSVEAPYTAELIFEVEKDGGLVFHPDGSVQLLVNVAVDGAVNCRGASFHLVYNQDYLTPSYIVSGSDSNGTHTVNEAFEDRGAEQSDGFFQPAELLGPGQNVQVFKEYSNALVGGHFGQEYYSHVDVGAGTIDMDLWFDNEAISAAVGGAAGAGALTQLSGISNEDETVYVFNKHDEVTATNQTVEKVTLGQLSFRVSEGRLAEIIDLFDGLEVVSSYRDPAQTPARPVVDMKTPDGKTAREGVRLIDIDHEGLSSREDPWQVGYYGGEAGDRHTMYYAPDREDHNIAERYSFHFDRDLVVDVALTEPDFTINAYQNFTAGNTGDLALSMGRWAGMVTVTYADGRKVNEPFPWGRADSGYTAKYVKKEDLDGDKPWRERAATAIAAYDPTANVSNPGVGTDYVFSQLYQTYKTDENGAYRKTAEGKYQVEQTFPIPVVGHMRVTPIQVLSVTAEDLTRTYLVSDVTNQVADAGDLALPAQARIVTDIVPGNVSLVTPIHGWKPVQPTSWQSSQPEVSTWPTSSMHTLKAQSYSADTETPYWPDPADQAATQASATQANFIGDYLFETSAADHQTAQDILKSDIQAQFPWLTVPQDSYPLAHALRRIVSQENYVGSKDYQVAYVSTVTESSLTTNGGGQPTLTLSVERADDRNMDPDSVFRVWLPNGLELGTGQNAGGVTVDNWFSDPGGADTHVHGFYKTETKSQSTGQQYFHLLTNPADPAEPLSATPDDEHHNGDRETLRRYINLGGWYRVAICEDPGTGDHWTDPIPVYVPPRRNEYQESKIYNFVAENQGLFNWPGGVDDVMAFPRGDYDPVAPDLHETNPSGTTAIGLPVYDVLAADGSVSEVTTALTNPEKIFAADVEGDLEPYVLKEDVRRHSESYGVETTYDGQTGAQPGMVYTVKVDDAIQNQDEDWNAPDNTEHTHASVGNDPVTRRGATPLQDEYRVTGFGTVNQPQGEAAYQATLRTQGEERASQEQLEKITLTSQADDGITRQPPGTKADNVTLVTFNTVTEGYTVRQSHLLTINNVGDVDIYGLDIDSLVDGYPLNDNEGRTAPEGGHFEITMPPASFLPAGASTNFILTYVYDLRANVDAALNYRDTLYITSTSHPTAGQGEDNLLDFDAELTVSANPLHQVTVIYRPTDGTMGAAALIVGEESAPGGVQMNTTSTTRTYAQGDRVYVEVQPLDEYEVKAIYADGTDVTVNEYSGAATLADGTEVHVFDMPNRDVTVYVDFYEPITSKLRLDELVDFSAPGTEVPGDIDLVKGYDPTGSYQPTDPGHIYQVWKKQFTDQDRANAAAWSAGVGNGYDEDFYLMTTGSAITAAQGGDVYDSSNAHYLVVIDSEDDFSQIKATLRNVKHHVDWQGLPDPSAPGYDAKYADGCNLDVKPTVNMEVYYQDQVGDNWKGGEGKAVYDTGHGYGPYDATGANLRPQGDTATNTQHITGHYDNSTGLASFESPAPGESAYVHIAITGAEEGGQSATRHYYVEIHRPTAETQAVLHYGNSPYGMIMNDTTQFTTSTVRDIAKSAFRAGYTFRNADVTVLPNAAKDKLQSVTYWREAWVRNRGLFEPESQTGFHQVTGSDGAPLYQNSAGETVAPKEDGSLPEDARSVYAPDGDVYNEADNLDLNDYAFFAILGQEMWEPGVVSAKDSSGRDVDLLNIHARALDRNGKDGVTLLDDGAASQVGRFSGTETAVIDLGVAGQKLTPVGGAVSGDPTLGVTQWPVQTTVTTQAGDDGAEETVTTYQAVENIRPGRYIIEYSYYDFDGETLLTVTRPLVILREVGDVNADGVRDAIDHPAAGHDGKTNDEYQIEDRVTDPLGYEAGEWDAAEKKETVYPSANIFKFRVADVNNDRNINNIDANQVAKNAKDNGGWLQFYDPVDYGHPGAPITAP